MINVSGHAKLLELAPEIPTEVSALPDAPLRMPQQDLVPARPRLSLRDWVRPQTPVQP